MIATILIAAVAVPARAAQYTQSSKVGDTTVKFTGPNTDQGKADVDAIKKAFDDAVSKSKDMTEKVKDAGSKYKNEIVMEVERDSRRVFIAQGHKSTGEIEIDPGDIEKVKDHLTGKDADKTTLIDANLTLVLAHEIDHDRGEKHDDPGLDKATKVAPIGLADKDANTVMEQMGIKVSRNEQLKQVDGKYVVTFTVNGQTVTLAFGDLVKARREANKFVPATEFATNQQHEQLLLNIPDHPCEEGQTAGCYQPDTANDGDLDGVSNEIDNAPGLANPQQADVDGDGIGSGVDPDDDGDGLLDEFEMAAGSAVVDPSSLPEHWTDPESCADGADEDKDGLVDGMDASCLVPPPATRTFPEPVGDAFPYRYPSYLRMDLGGGPEGMDALRGTAHLGLDFNGDGTVDPDGNASASGTWAIQRFGPYADAATGTMRIDTQLLALSLAGSNPRLGQITIRTSSAPVTQGIIQDANPDPAADFPATSSFGLFLRITGPGPDGQAGTSDDVDLHNQDPIPIRATLNRWPDYGNGWAFEASSGGVQLFDAQGAPEGEIITSGLSIATPDSQHHRRAVSLRLGAGRGLTASGRVSELDPVFECVQDVLVNVQRRVGGRWKTVTTVHTDAEGSYSASLPDRPGVYRSQTPPRSLGREPDLTCLRAFSPTRKHG